MNLARFFLIGVLAFLLGCRQQQLSPDPLAEKIDRQDAIYDIKFFRELLDDAHPSLHEYISTQRLNTIFDSIMASVPDKLPLRELFHKLTFITNEIGCSHTTTQLPASIDDTLFNRKLFFPFPTILIENKLYINSDQTLDHGTQILTVNGRSATSLLDSLALYNSVDGFHRQTQKEAAAADFAYEYYMRFGCPDKFELVTREKDGKAETHIFEPVTLREWNERFDARYYFDAEDVTYHFRINEEKKYAVLRIADFNLGSDNSEAAFEHFLKNNFQLLSFRKDVKDLIIDLRENTGGWLYNCFLLNSYLSPKPFDEYQDVTTRISTIPYKSYLVETTGTYDTAEIRESLEEEFLARTSNGYRIPDSLIKKWAPDKYRFTGRVYIITNHAVSSAASYFTWMAQTYSDAKVVGVETSGGTYNSNGFHMLKYQLPQTFIRIRFPYARLQYHSDRSGRGRGVLPDYVKPDSDESFSENEDLQIKFIIDSLLSKNR
ncbi:MAG: S41 family peptidase [Bacteroidetes bacterium]|nr:S41 family peptidase [Bacteroidota bacterium]